jgi:hypothetical protein
MIKDHSLMPELTERPLLPRSQTASISQVCVGGQNYHNFEPRYSEGWTTYPVFKEKVGEVFVTENREGIYKTYIYDICTRCGKIIKPSEDKQ